MMSRMMSTVSACVLCLAHLPWTKEVKYLGIYLVSSKRFKICTEHSRCSFYSCRVANAIFGRIGRIATEEVVLHLLLTKCVPILLYGLEAFSIRIMDLDSLDFVVNRFFVKLFHTSNIDTVKECQMFSVLKCLVLFSRNGLKNYRNNTRITRILCVKL